MPNETPEPKKPLSLPNDTKILSAIAKIGEALDEMCLHTRGTARRHVLKDRVLEMVTEIIEVAYKHGSEETNDTALSSSG